MTREIEAKGKSRYQRLLQMKWQAKGSVISIHDEDCARPQDVMRVLDALGHWLVFDTHALREIDGERA